MSAEQPPFIHQIPPELLNHAKAVKREQEQTGLMSHDEHMDKIRDSKDQTDYSREVADREKARVLEVSEVMGRAGLEGAGIEPPLPENS